MTEENRGPWYLLTGLVLGIVFGLVFSWVILPVQYVDTAPDTLRDNFKDNYRALIAVAYLSSGNVERARVRLKYIESDSSTNPNERLRLLAEGNGRTPGEVQALTLLADALSGQDAAVTPPSPEPATKTIQPTLDASTTPVLVQTDATVVAEASLTPESGTPSPRSTITRTPTVLPSRTPTLTPGAPFVLQSQEKVCDLAVGEGLIQLEVFDAANQPVPGIEVQVRWEGGEDFFYTGLKPEFNSGYADFEMTPGIDYQLQLATGGAAVTDLTALECDGEAGRFWGGWRLTFIQP